ncbi:Predicted lactoylglutathione lyase [Pedobacter westerhofensis]|uniref:Predicted lactoylglutathione lyase n=1 Tax=Pedobacter westerhofensis TaxID=425512 RepID=A0A521EV03_9SPHI|nr:VOC family protein [Pedobacter westerhofensis]SMO87753.1 Predicted lactoylglutathione lyase [Pedobacter westerhofensis]
MIDHVIITVNSFERSVEFYTRAFEPLGIKMNMDFEGENGHPALKGFGNGKTVFFWLKEGKSSPAGVHIGLIAEGHKQVDTFYEAAMEAGAKTIHAPRIFTEYYPGYYAAWVTDPDGYELELVHKS